MERLRSFLGVLGIIFLCSGAYVIIANFTINRSTMIKPGFLTPDKWQAGLFGVGLLFLGLLIYAWLLKGMFLTKSMDSPDFKKSNTSAFSARKTANEKGYFLLFMLSVIIIAILYYAYR